MTSQTADTASAGHSRDIVNVAIVGAGGMGQGVARNLMKLPDVRIVAVADPADTYQDDFFYRRPVGRLALKAEIEAHHRQQDPQFTCADYLDFRVMLEEHQEIDAIVCATPDHLHAYVSVTAMRLGKHVYCEKPMAHSIWEARLMAKVAAETGVATQMGNIGHARDGMRETCEWLWAGAIGNVREVHAWVPATRWNKGMIQPPQAPDPQLGGIDWDLWLGPREPVPTHPAYHPVKWRDFWAFGLGGIGDFFCHDVDVACWALDLRDPLTIEGFICGQTHPDMTGHGDICHYTFGPTAKRPGLKLTWYDGGLRPPTPEGWPAGEPLSRRGIYFVGDEGILVEPGLGERPRLFPASRAESFVAPPPSLPRSPGHHREWIDACKGGAPAMSDFAYSARLTELALLGVLALRTGKKIVWNAAAMQAEGVPEADAIIRVPYRQGWEIA